MSKENPNKFKIINKNERLHYRLIINELKQQLAEKDKLLKCYQEEEKLIADILGDKDLTLIGSRVHLKNLIVELKNKIKDKDIVIEEKDKEIERLNHKLNVEEPCLIRNYKDMLEQLIQSHTQLEQEIEKLKQQYTILENENGKLTTELIMDKYKKAQKEVSFGKQLAIQELEKTLNFIENVFDKALKNCSLNNGYYDQILDFIDQQIKELKGE